MSEKKVRDAKEARRFWPQLNAAGWRGRVGSGERYQRALCECVARDSRAEGVVVARCVADGEGTARVELVPEMVMPPDSTQDRALSVEVAHSGLLP